MTTAEILAVNVPSMALFFALWVGIPMWMITRRPDRHPRETRTVPAYLRQRATAGQHAQRRGAVRVGAQRRELAWASRS